MSFFFSILQVWLLSSYQLPNLTHCIELLTVKFTQVSSEKNLVKWKLSWGWESHCADTVSCQSVVTRIFNNLPVCSAWPHPKFVQKIVSSGDSFAFCQKSPTVHCHIWWRHLYLALCSNGTTTIDTFWIFYQVRNLNFPLKKVDCENLVKTLCTVTSYKDICIWLRLFWSNGITTIQLTLFELFSPCQKN